MFSNTMMNYNILLLEYGYLLFGFWWEIDSAAVYMLCFHSSNLIGILGLFDIPVYLLCVNFGQLFGNVSMLQAVERLSHGF